MTSVARLLAASELPRAEARRLLAHALGTTIEALVAQPERAIDADSQGRFAALQSRRAQGEPLAYLVGEKEFFGRRFAVSPAVLVPRPETERLVEIALDRLARRPAPRLLDLGTGSGCIAITLALECPTATAVAVDCSRAALQLARGNAHRLGARVEFLLGDWFEPVRGRFDLIVANPPYVASADPHLDELRHEPPHALIGGADGLDELRRIVAAAPAYLNSGGWLVVEHGHDQGEGVRTLFEHTGLVEVATFRDLAGLDRVCVGTAAAAG